MSDSKRQLKLADVRSLFAAIALDDFKAYRFAIV